MNTRSLPQQGAMAVLTLVYLTACAPATIGITPGTIVSTIIANIPMSTSSTVSRGGGTTTTTTSRAPARARIPDSPPPSAAAAHVLQTGEQYLGVRYVWGGNTPAQGFDCSGFTKYVFAKYGITLPRTSREQAHAGMAVPADFRYLRPGDIMLFAEPGQAISHVAIYAGDGRILHSSSSVGGVGYTDLNTGSQWFVQYFVAARRLLQ